MDRTSVQEPIGRHFLADLPRQHEQELGIQVSDHHGVMTVVQVSTMEEGGAIPEWNQRCSGTFPEDTIRVGDRITTVNGKTKLAKMMTELAQSTDLFLTLSRETRTES